MNDGPRLPASSPGAVVRAPPSFRRKRSKILRDFRQEIRMGCLSPALSSSCGSPSTSSSLVFFLELATKTTLERYPQEATSPRKLRSPCLRYCGRPRGARRYRRPRGARRYRVSSFFVRNCGICTRKWWFSNPFLPQLTPGPRYLPRSSSETQDTTMVIEAEVPTEYYTAIRSEGAQHLILRLSSTACRQASNDALPSRSIDCNSNVIEV